MMVKKSISFTTQRYGEFGFSAITFLLKNPLIIKNYFSRIYGYRLITISFFGDAISMQ